LYCTYGRECNRRTIKFPDDDDDDDDNNILYFFRRVLFGRLTLKFCLIRWRPKEKRFTVIPYVDRNIVDQFLVFLSVNVLVTNHRALTALMLTYLGIAMPRWLPVATTTTTAPATRIAVRKRLTIMSQNALSTRIQPVMLKSAV